VLGVLREVRAAMEDVGEPEGFHRLRETLAKGGAGLDGYEAGTPFLTATWAELLEGYRLLDQILMLSQFDPAQVKDHHPEGTVNPEFKKAQEEKKKLKRYSRDHLAAQKGEELDALLGGIVDLIARESGVWLVRILRGSSGGRYHGTVEQVLGQMEKTVGENRYLKDLREALEGLKEGVGSFTTGSEEVWQGLEKKFREGEAREEKP
jgi:hypothetical protein